MKVNKIDLPETLTEKTALEYIGRIAAVCTKAEVKSDEQAYKIGKMNLTESCGKPTRAWEYLPVNTFLCNGNDFDRPAEYYNFREAINFGCTVKDIIKAYYEDIAPDFHTFKLTIPRFVFHHIKTHTTLSTLGSSARIGVNDEKEYWFPEVEKSYKKGFINRIKGFLLKPVINTLNSNDGTYFYENSTHKQFSYLLNKLYKRKEITRRPLSDFELVDMAICGYNEAWENFFNVRSKKCEVCNVDCTKRCVQDETAFIALEIKKLMNK